jgi:DNA-binding XRE family transcriptional regulator|tara:strand:+ start:506 stop:868 length:363 start_codon:yes stop_codon:yes gene_type:complete
MATTLKKMINQLPPERRRRVKARAHELIAEELSLRDLRKALNLTQDHVAETLNIGQDSVSRLEQRSDLLLSTLGNYVSAMGGSIELIARFPDRPPVTLLGLTGLSNEDVKPKRKSRARPT